MIPIKTIKSDLGQTIAGKLAGLGEASKKLEHIYNSDNTVLHNGEEQDLTEEYVKTFLSESDFDDVDEKYEELEETDFSSDEIFDVLKDGIKFGFKTDRRTLLKAFGGSFGVTSIFSYGLDVKSNYDRLEELNADNFEAPSGAAYGDIIVEQVLEGDPVEIEILNITDGEEEYDEEKVESEVKSALEELDGLEAEVIYHEADPTWEGFIENVVENSDLTEEDIENWSDERIESYKEHLEKLRSIINNNDLTGPVKEENVHPFLKGREDHLNPHSLARNIDNYSLIFDNPDTGNDLMPTATLRIIAADFEKGDAGGMAYGTMDSAGYDNVALVNDSYSSSIKEFIGVTVHELGHKFGLPHTKYPDFKRMGFLPDVMSYSEGVNNFFEHVDEFITGDFFEAQSHYNWEVVKEYFREREDEYVEVNDHGELDDRNTTEEPS